MRRVHSQIDKERLAGFIAALNEIHRFADVHIRAVILRLIAVMDFFAIFVQGVIEFAIGIRAEEALYHSFQPGGMYM